MAVDPGVAESSWSGVAVWWRHFVIAAALLVGLLLIQYLASSGMDRPSADQLRYANYSVNLAHFGTFGLSPADSAAEAEPGNANAPLYPLLVAGVIKLDPALDTSLICALEDVAETNPCATEFGSLEAVQYLLALICLLLLWASCLLMFGKTTLATGAALLAGLSGVYSGYAEKLLTEILLLPLFAGIQLCLLLVIKSGRARWSVATGLLLGLLTLTRPEGFHLALLLAVVFTVMLVLVRRVAELQLVVVAVLAFVVTVAPWAVRNQLQFGAPSLTTGGYGETILAYRLSFNRMTANEWATAFIYWLPDFGDKLAQQTVAEPHYRRLVSDNSDSFIATARADILQPALDKMPREEVLGHWLKTEILGKPITHLWTSVPIFWRGIWVAKYWGIVGLLSYLVLLKKLPRDQRRALLWFSLPVWLLALLHTGISINIPRYNLPLVPVYAIGWGWLVMKVVSRQKGNHHPAMAT